MTKAPEVKDQERVAARSGKDEELASQTKHFQETEERLVQEAATGFADGFCEALVQAACANPSNNVSERESLRRSSRWQDRAFDGSRGLASLHNLATCL
ncbi:hypothetical protein ACSQ67_016513 [Phaseolus vulgaris]